MNWAKKFIFKVLLKEVCSDCFDCILLYFFPSGSTVVGHINKFALQDEKSDLIEYQRKKARDVHEQAERSVVSSLNTPPPSLSPSSFGAIYNTLQTPPSSPPYSPPSHL